MKSIHIILYHSVYWIYRIINTLAFNHFLFKEDWYKGAYVVQLVLMPFFYINYALLIPYLISKKYKKFILLSSFWLISFIWIYSNWTIYQRRILYGEDLWAPNYIETSNNVIYIWLISACFCFFEFWIKNLKKNQELALMRKKHLLKSEENLMLNNVLSDSLGSLDKKAIEELPERILCVSDFFKYVLYNRDVPVTLETEIEYVKIFQELKNSKGKCVEISFGTINKKLLIRASEIITAINRLIEVLSTDHILQIKVESNKSEEVLISVLNSNVHTHKVVFENEFANSKITQESKTGNYLVLIDRYKDYSSVGIVT